MDYSKMTSSDLIAACKDDANKWAAAFVQRFPDCGVDEGTMLGWFANAIEVAHDHRMAQIDNAPLPAQDPDPVAAMDAVYDHLSLFEQRISALEESVSVLKHNEAQIQALRPA